MWLHVKGGDPHRATLSGRFQKSPPVMRDVSPSGSRIEIWLKLHFTEAHVISCLSGSVLPPPPSSYRCITKPTHASALLSSPTGGCSCALYLMRLVWCFSDMPSCCHHNTHSYSCALCSHRPISYFHVRSIFIPRKRYIPLKKNKKKQHSVTCGFSPSCTTAHGRRGPAVHWGHLSDLFN